MRRIMINGVAIATVLAWIGSVHAGVIIDTIPTNDRANLSVDAGQSFTTGTLGTANLLATIEIQGPRNDVPDSILGPFALALYDDVDQDPNTFDRGSLLGTSTLGTIIPGDGSMQSGGITTFTFLSPPALVDNTVYSFRYEDGAGNPMGARVGLTNGTNGGAPPLADGALFSGGVTPFNNAYDTSMRITTIPEPSSVALICLALVGVVGLRRLV